MIFMRIFRSPIASCFAASCHARLAGLKIHTQKKPISSIASTPETKIPNLQRTRRTWTEEEVKLLMKRKQDNGVTWTQLSRELGRTPSTLIHRYRMEKGEEQFLGPWDQDELDMLRRLTKGQINSESIDWIAVQERLPRLRLMSHILMTWKHTVNPVIKHGKWSAEEIDLLKRLVDRYGSDNWDAIASKFGTRTRRQIIERYRWQMCDTKKGRFSPEENAAILEAVKKHGDSNFALIQHVTGIKRTPRHISQHYNYALDTKFNREPWTFEEEVQLYTTYQTVGNMVLTIEKLGTNRTPKVAWNHYRRIERLVNANKLDPRSFVEAQPDKDSSNIPQ